MTTPEELEPAGKTETTTRTYDKDGQLIEERTTTIVHLQPKRDDLPIGQYL